MQSALHAAYSHYVSLCFPSLFFFDSQFLWKAPTVLCWDVTGLTNFICMAVKSSLWKEQVLVICPSLSYPGTRVQHDLDWQSEAESVGDGFHVGTTDYLAIVTVGTFVIKIKSCSCVLAHRLWEEIQSRKNNLCSEIFWKKKNGLNRKWNIKKYFVLI